MAELTPRQRWAVVAPAAGIVLLAAGGLAWLALARFWTGSLAALAGLAAIAWGITAQARDPVLRNRKQPPMPGGGGSESGR
jgi:hypothetical protein